MGSIIKTIAIVLTIIILLFIAYSIYTANSYRGCSAFTEVPQPYKSLYNKFNKIPILGSLISSYKNDLTLIYGSETYARILIAIYSTVIPLASIVAVTVVLFFIDTWYFQILLSLEVLIIPYLMITNSLILKARRIRKGFSGFYEAAEQLYSGSIQTIQVFTNLRDNCRGAQLKICEQFLDIYILDNEKAYTYFSDTVGDKYGNEFIASVREYDEYGVNPCTPINNARRECIRFYMLKFAHINILKAFQKLALVVLGISIFLGYYSDSIYMADATGSSYLWLTYLAICVACYAFTYSLYLERS